MVKVKLTISISCRDNVNPDNENLSFLLISKQSPLSWLQNPSEHATSEPSGELMREEDPDIVSQQPEKQTCQYKMLIKAYTPLECVIFILMYMHKTA